MANVGGLNFSMFCPTAEHWLQILSSRKAELENPHFQMSVLLNVIRHDIDKQFDENQSTWTKLKPYTIEKKIQLHADLRILHETKQGEGLRLRDAYMLAGEVTEAGRIIYSYPESKPYAKDHQEGINRSPEPGRKKEKKGKQSFNWRLADELRHFDREFLRKIRED
jgi:hypothetical protein